MMEIQHRCTTYLAEIETSQAGPQNPGRAECEDYITELMYSFTLDHYQAAYLQAKQHNENELAKLLFPNPLQMIFVRNFSLLPLFSPTGTSEVEPVTCSFSLGLFSLVDKQANAKTC